MDDDRKKIRRSVGLLLAVSTLVFVMVLLFLSVLNVRIPQQRLDRIEALIESGDTESARRFIAALSDEAEAERFYARCDYLDGETAFAAGDWAAARAFYASAGSWKDSGEKVLACDYQLAGALFDAGEYEAAEAAFTALGGYGDAADRALSCRYERAAALERAGETSKAGALFDTLGSYRDAPERLAALAVAVTGVDDAEEALSAFRGMTPEQRERMAALSAARESLPQGIVAVGFYHTVGLGPDGRVLACGDNSFGQCGVDALHDVTAVAAGAYHTLALHRDGTVSAVGRDSEGQCDTAQWRGVTAIAASDYASFGLRDDGTLLAVGFYDFSEPLSWSALEAVAGGSYNLAALRSDGTVWTYPRLKNTEALRGCVTLAVNTGYVVGAMKDGSAVSSVFDLSDWQEVVALSASGTAILGLDLNGRVLSHFFRESDAIDFSACSDVRAIAAGGTHFALVRADGSVTVLGANDHGEANTEDWDLF